MNIRAILAAGATICTLACCDNKNGGQEQQPTSNTTISQHATIPSFDANAAYTHVAAQVAFGPRLPGTEAQLKCAAYMEQELKKVVDTVYRQNATVIAGNKKQLRCINLIGVINPAAKKRILLLTHWDSRPWSDEDAVDKTKPVLAADDGASGVAVLLEIARQVQTQKIPGDVGVDILLEDVEDYGKDEWGEDSYCRGTQYWIAHPHVAGYKADFGILLDMVGAKNAVFPKEATSAEAAGDIQSMFYRVAGQAGYSSFFPPDANNKGVTDDHTFINRLTQIPTIDIINLSGNGESPFAAHWHTIKDQLDVIDKTTLKAVGQTVLQVIYKYGQGS